MTDDASDPLDRIERALARIQAAAAAHVRDGARLAERHDALRSRIGEAIEALDAVIADKAAD